MMLGVQVLKGSCLVPIYDWTLGVHGYHLSPTYIGTRTAFVVSLRPVDLLINTARD